MLLHGYVVPPCFTWVLKWVFNFEALFMYLINSLYFMDCIYCLLVFMEDSSVEEMTV